jgi:hypothetical protein|tara:strand:- start:512 stop:1231 length:720 start_codon:yes stop_codon:yes gene_type:complete
MNFKLRLPRWFLQWTVLTMVAAVALLVYMSGVWAWVPSGSVPNLSVPTGKDTLKELIQGGRFSTITLSGIQLGPPPDSAGGVAFSIFADSGKRITGELVTLNASSCEKLTVSDSEFSTLEVTDNESDGNSFGYSTTSLSSITVASTRDMLSRGHQDESFDWAYIDGGSGAIVKTLYINFQAFGGVCTVSNLAYDVAKITNGTWGNGTGINGEKTLVFETTTAVAIVTTSGNLESGVDVR